MVVSSQKTNTESRWSETTIPVMAPAKTVIVAAKVAARAEPSKYLAAWRKMATPAIPITSRNTEP